MVGRKILGAALGALLLGTVSVSADTIKVGIIGPFSGPFALQGKNFQAGVEAFMALNGKSVKGHDVEVIYRDLPAANPAQSRALAQELVVKDKVQYLGGVYFTPDAMAITPLLEAGERAAGDLQRRDVGHHEHVARSWCAPPSPPRRPPRRSARWRSIAASRK